MDMIGEKFRYSRSTTKVIKPSQFNILSQIKHILKIKILRSYKFIEKTLNLICASNNILF